MAPGPFQRLLVVSPHCDDAVLSCGSLLETHPGSAVVTVFAGTQPAGQPLTE
jgi:LmbE family N-acetylglucosaminyl deacetylase